ncbi:hypothetical protein ACFO9Q_05750 [Paenibacillus sp. GCM10023252]|uniref:hypothetical protein n=1 Tax=Paenibacillus sp. GCM10023252 TaxID=3252649 RepID=UPI00360FF63C
MIRSLYLSYLNEAVSEAEALVLKQLVEQQLRRLVGTNQGINEATVFHEERYLCTYLEHDDGVAVGSFDWSGELLSRLAAWPTLTGCRYAVELTDVYHDGVPHDRTSWKEGRRIDDRVGAIARLRPDWAASYIFYHYQQQEEKPESFNKSYLIGYYDNLLFSYAELPAVVSPIKPEGKLRTSHSPEAGWHELMEPHFHPWEDGELWKRVKHLCTVTREGWHRDVV